MFNKILDDSQRERYSKIIEELHINCPSTIKNKVPQANVQQAFVLDTVRHFHKIGSKILSVGAYEDTASESLRKLGYDITEIDPLDEIWNPKDFSHIIKTDLQSFFNKNSIKYDIIFSTSVIEHVEDDETFIDQICKMLNEDSYGILTCDFNESYKPGDRKPVVDYRLYTTFDFTNRFKRILDENDCHILEPYDWNGYPDFDNGQAVYSFATFVFKKNKKNKK